MEIFLVRHTTPLIESGICYGQSDISVNENFEQESERLIDALPPVIDLLYSSPLKRCTVLAKKIISSSIQVRGFLTEPFLKEINFGNWELQKWDDIKRKEFENWSGDIVNNKIPGGEAFTDLNLRVNSFIDQLVQSDAKKVAVITHAGVIRCFFARINCLSLNQTLNLKIDYASVHRLKVF